MKAKFVLTKDLLQQKSYREFLECLIQTESKNGAVNFSELSRRAGFSSRSFIKEIIEGKKGLTASSLAKIKKAFRLTGLLGNYFEMLVSLEEEHINIQQLQHEVILNKINKLRSRLLTQLENENLSPEQSMKIFLNRYTPEVYAALGSEDEGSSLEDIVNRTRLTENNVMNVLEHLLQLKVISKIKDRFFVTNLNLDIFGQGSNLSFQNVYLQALNKLNDHAKKEFNHDENLFFHSAFSVSSSKLPELKEKLRKVVLDLLDEEQMDNGDQVARITLGLY